jgi:cysteine desulfurase
MIYLDHAAATPLRTEALEAMLPYFTEHYGNPSSLHTYGQKAKLAVGRARDLTARIVGCEPGEIVWTSGGTESDNLALFGITSAAAAVPGNSSKKHIITSQIEHHAVLHACAQLEREGFEVTYVPAGTDGQVSLAAVEQAIRPDTLMISLMFGNNETGTLQPVYEVGKLAKERNVIMHVDAVQALGVETFHLSSSPFDLVSFSAHKINGPKGTGALFVRKGIGLTPRLFGGTQERSKRAGTENIAGIVGFAKALELAYADLRSRTAHLSMLRDRMIEIFRSRLDEEQWVINGHTDKHLPHILNVSFPGTHTETMLMNLDLEGIAAASGSACSSGSLEPSHVLRAMGLPDSILHSAVRFSFGFGTRVEDVETAANKTATILDRLRNR